MLPLTHLRHTLQFLSRWRRSQKNWDRAPHHRPGLNGLGSLHQYQLDCFRRGSNPNKNPAHWLTEVMHPSSGRLVSVDSSCRCGKTSIQQVLFNGLPPKDAFFIEPTTKVVKTAYESVVSLSIDSAWTFKKDSSSTVIPLEIWDCPGSLTISTLPTPLSQFPTIVFVIDIQVCPPLRFLGRR